MIRTHEITGQRLLFKRGGSIVATYYLLDENDNKIQNGFTTKGLPYYKVVVCQTKNII